MRFEKIRKVMKSQNKGQVNDRSRIRVKEKLSNDNITSFESFVCGDPYGI